MDDLLFLIRILQVALGIGLVIFVHELGHFLAARWCGVRVEVFSLGFGPRLIGWKRGTTTYQIAAVPLGGYVKMKGDEGYRQDPAPTQDDLQSKTVGQRFFIYSAGVVMNVILGVVVFPILFAVGVPFHPPVVGEIVPGGPAWLAGLHPQDEVLRVNGEEVFEWTHIITAVAVGDPEQAELEIRDHATGELRTVRLATVYDERGGFPSIEVMPPNDPDGTLVVAKNSSATAAGLSTGDRIVDVEGGLAGADLLQQLNLVTQDGDPLRLRVTGEAGERDVVIRPERLEGRPLLGIQRPWNVVVALRESPLAESLDLRAKDRLIAAQGRPILRQGDLTLALLEEPGPLRLDVLRGARPLTLEGPALTRDEALQLVDALAIGVDPDSTEIVPSADHAGYLAGLRDRDEIISIDGQRVNRWKDVIELVGAAGKRGDAVVLSVLRPSAYPAAPGKLDITATPAAGAMWNYGIDIQRAQYVFQTDGPVESVKVGLACSWKFVQHAWLTLKSMVRGQISTENIGGIITIGAVSYSWANQGLAKLMFFLCMLSINLAFINVLPIPVLDGGHLFFLLVEKLKGSPVSDRVLGYSQMVGLVLILSLMVYVTFNDIQRWFFPS